MGFREGQVAGKFTKEEEEVIREEAEGQGMTVSEYVRAGVFISLIMDGNTKAMGLMAGLVRRKLAEKFAKFVGEKVGGKVAG
jgi:hypothetical protein